MTHRVNAITWLVVLMIAACHDDPPAAPRPAAAPRAEVSSDVTRLEKLVTLQTKPSSVLFRYEQRGGGDDFLPAPSDSSITAVLRYSAEQAQSLAAPHAEPEDGQLPLADWFPAELKALATTSADGRSVLKVKRYPASAFTRAPYLNGVLMRVDDSPYFVLSVYTT